jgi:hypothetical protein
MTNFPGYDFGPDELHESMRAAVVRPAGETPAERVAAILDHAEHTITTEQRDAILAAYGIPAEAIGCAPVDDLVHWRGVDEQGTFTPLGLFRPTRCGRYGIATLGYPLEYVTCGKCRALAEEDDEHRQRIREEQYADVEVTFEVPPDFPTLGQIKEN